MFLRACVLFCIPVIANLQRIALPKEVQNDYNDTCLRSQEDSIELINGYFCATTAVRDTTSLQYCDQQMAASRLLDLGQLIDLYKKFELVNSYKHISSESPITHSGVLSINEHQELPLFVTADIRYHHTRVQPDSGFRCDVEEQMDLMSQLSTDDRGYLLAHSLGGKSRGSNVVPMAQNLHRRLAVNNENYHSETNRTLPPPKSFWRSHEDWIQRFLQIFPNGRVAWRLAVQYADGVVADPRSNRSYRPVSFALQYSAYTNYSDSSSHYMSIDTTYLNDNTDSCRHIREQSLSGSLRCDHSFDRFGTVRRGTWPMKIKVSFPFTIEGRTFFYGQSIIEGRFWFIQELLPNGDMGEAIKGGQWNNNYEIMFPFSIGGRLFYYTFSNSVKEWYIQELLPGGDVGQETSGGHWSSVHQVSIPFSIGGEQYFYGQIESGNRWFIKKLLPNGKMGVSTGFGCKEKVSPVVFLYQVGDRHFLYSHNTDNKTWYVQELLPGGTLGEEMNHGRWTWPHHTSVPFSVNDRHYFFGQNLDNGNWFVQELLPNGRMGERLRQGAWDDQYSVVFTYVGNGNQYLFGLSAKTKKWIIYSINELLPTC